MSIWPFSQGHMIAVLVTLHHSSLTKVVFSWRIYSLCQQRFDMCQITKELQTIIEIVHIWCVSKQFPQYVFFSHLWQKWWESLSSINCDSSSCTNKLNLFKPRLPANESNSQDLLKGLFLVEKHSKMNWTPSSPMFLFPTNLSVELTYIQTCQIKFTKRIGFFYPFSNVLTSLGSYIIA